LLVACSPQTLCVSSAEYLSCFASDLGRMNLSSPSDHPRRRNTIRWPRVHNYWQSCRKLYCTRRAVPSAANYPAPRDYTRRVKTCKIKTISCTELRPNLHVQGKKYCSMFTGFLGVKSRIATTSGFCNRFGTLLFGFNNIYVKL
jgi:hypothetical protein